MSFLRWFVFFGMVWSPTALAGKNKKPFELKVQLMKSEDEILPTAAIWFAREQNRHSVNTANGTLTISVLYLSGGAEIILEQGLELTGYVSAPGYQLQKVPITLTNKRKQSLVLTLIPLDFDRFKGEPSATADKPTSDTADVDGAHAEALRQIASRNSKDATEWAQRTIKDVRASDDSSKHANAIYDAKAVLALAATLSWMEAADRWVSEWSTDNLYLKDRARELAALRAKEWRESAQALERPLDLALDLCRAAEKMPENCD